MQDKLPISSLLYAEQSQYKHCDCFPVVLKRSNVESWELISAFFQSVPGWVDKLFVLRNKIVGHPQFEWVMRLV